MIPEPGDPNREVHVNETFHVQTNDELTKKEHKHIEADDQTIQTILLDLPKDIYATVDSCETAQEIWLLVQQMMKGSDIGIQEKKDKLFSEWEREINTFQKRLPAISSFKNLQVEWSRHVTIVHQTKDLHAAYYTQLYDFLKYNQKEVDDLKAERLAKTQDPLALMATSNNPYTFPVLHQDQPSFNKNYMQQLMPNPKDITDPTTTMNMVTQNVVQNPRIHNTGNQNGLIVVPGNANQNLNENGNLVAVRAKGNATRHNGNQIRCYNCRGFGYFDRNCTVKPRRRDAAYLQTQLLIDQKEEARIQLQAEEFDLMAAAADLDEIEKVNINCILMANLQQVSTLGTQTDKAPVYDSDGSVEVHNYEDCYDNEIFNMFTQEERYTELLEPISKPHQVPQNNNNVISEVSNVEQSGHKALELEIERPLRAVVSQDIMFVVQNNSVDETSNLQTELECMKERFENYIIINENDYAKLWNDWYKKCEECKFDKILYDKAYNDMQQKIRRLQAQLGDLKGKSKDTSCVSDTLNPLSQKLENKNIELEFQVLNYAKENDHLKTTYKNLFDSISVTRNQSKTIIDSLQNKLHDTIYENAKLRAQLFDKVFDQKDTACGTSANTKFAKQSILGKPPKVGMFRINPFKPSREEKHAPNKVRASARTNPITVSEPPVITKKVVNSNSNGLSSTGIENTKTRRPQSRSNTKNDRVLSVTPQQNRVVECRNRTLVEAARTMLIFSRAPLFLWAEAIATAYFTQIRSIIHRRFTKTPYELNNGRKPDISFLHVFGALCYPKNDREDILKLGVKGGIGFFIGYSADSCAFRVYNRSSGLNLTYAPSTITTQQPTKGELDLLFEATYDDYIGGQPSSVPRTILATQAHQGTTDLTLFIRRFVDDILVVQVYVDDIIFSSTHPRYTQLFSDLMKSHFEMSMMGEMTFFLGLQVNQSPCGIFINQSNYVLEILKKYEMESCDPVGNLMEIKDKLDLDKNGTPVKPTEKHLKEVKRIFLYLRGTINTGLWYTKDSGFEPTRFSDADYARCKDTFKSTFGGAQFLGEKLVSWSSKK
nr:uncharacterized mitochondrial protein AtMg00810-like [Tanacetum cinerariifolium]